MDSIQHPLLLGLAMKNICTLAGVLGIAFDEAI